MYTHVSSATVAVWAQAHASYMSVDVLPLQKNQKNHIHLFCDPSAQRAPIFERNKYPSHFKPSQLSYFSAKLTPVVFELHIVIWSCHSPLEWAGQAVLETNH
jgi:hypothetical protein